MSFQCSHSKETCWRKDLRDYSILWGFVWFSYSCPYMGNPREHFSGFLHQELSYAFLFHHLLSRILVVVVSGAKTANSWWMALQNYYNNQLPEWSCCIPKRKKHNFPKLWSFSFAALSFFKSSRHDGYASHANTDSTSSHPTATGEPSVIFHFKVHHQISIALVIHFLLLHKLEPLNN